MSEDKGGCLKDCRAEHHSVVSARFINRCESIGGCATFLVILELDRLNEIQRITKRGDNL
jgi:hypothetical protein